MSESTESLGQDPLLLQVALLRFYKAAMAEWAAPGNPQRHEAVLRVADEVHRLLYPGEPSSKMPVAEPGCSIDVARIATVLRECLRERGWTITETRGTQELVEALAFALEDQSLISQSTATVPVHLTLEQIERLIGGANHQLALATHNWNGDPEMADILARLQAARSRGGASQ